MFSDTTGEVLWSITQITDATLSMTSETADVTDAIGNVITQFDRSKNAEFSGSNALWDFGLSAAQFGSEKVVASDDNKIVTPIYEQLKVAEGQTVTLSHTPKSDVKYIYVLNNDSTLGEKYQVSASEAEEEGKTFTIQDSVITVPDDLPVGTNIAVFYDYETTTGVMLQNNASDFPKAGKFMLEVIGKDTCDKTAIYVAYLVFPNAKLKTDMDLSFTSDGGHPFSLQMMQDYCDLEKRLFNIYVDEGVPSTPTKPTNKEPITPPQNQVISELGNRPISDLITPDTKIDATGKATGHTHYLYNWEEFSKDSTQNSGNFFPIQLPAAWEGKQVELEGSKNGKKTITVDPDLLLIQRLENLTSDNGGTPNKLKMTLKDSTTPVKEVRSGNFVKKISEENVKTIDFTAVDKEDGPLGKEAVRIANQEEDMDAVKPASKLMEPDVTITWNGIVGKMKGHVRYHDFTGTGHFTNAPTGHFVGVVLQGYDQKKITATGSTGATSELTDPKWIIRVDGFLKEGATNKRPKLASGNTTIAEFDLTGLTLNDPATVPSQGTELGEVNGSKVVSDLIGTDAKITWENEGENDQTTGKATGLVKYVSRNDAYGDEQKSGHFFPIKFDEQYIGETLHVGGIVKEKAFENGKDITPTKEDPYLVVRVENLSDGKKLPIYDKEHNDEVYTIDFTEANLEKYPTGKEAMIIPEQTRDFGSFGKASDYIGPNLTIEWNGIKGTVKGDILYKKNAHGFNGDEVNGHYYPLVLTDFYKSKSVTVTVSKDKTATETDWILYLDKDTADKTVNVKCENQEVLVLDFSKATFKQDVEPSENQ